MSITRLASRLTRSVARTAYTSKLVSLDELELAPSARQAYLGGNAQRLLDLDVRA